MVKIGSAYQRFWYRERFADGSYRALRAPMSRHEEILQEGLLRKRLGDPGPDWWRTGILLTVMILAVAVLAVALP